MKHPMKACRVDDQSFSNLLFRCEQKNDDVDVPLRTGMQGMPKWAPGALELQTYLRIHSTPRNSLMRAKTFPSYYRIR